MFRPQVLIGTSNSLYLGRFTNKALADQIQYDIPQLPDYPFQIKSTSTTTTPRRTLMGIGT